MKHAASPSTTDPNGRNKPLSHGEILKLIWKNLDLGTLDRNHPFHTPVFATVNDGFPEARMVVLRRFWRKPPGIAFHAHAGSPKVAQVIANPNVAWQFYHPGERIQIRVRGRATVHSDGELHEEQWTAADLLAKRCYIGEAPTIVSDRPSSGLPDGLADRRPTHEEAESGRPNFVVIHSTIDEIDCLELYVKGHRRSLFTWDGGELKTKWLTP